MGKQQNFSALLQLGKETVVYGLASVLANLVSVLLIPIYTRTFEPSDYGIITMVGTVVLLATSLVGLGAEAGVSVLFYEACDGEGRRACVFHYLFLQITTAFVVSGGLVLAAGPLTAWLLGPDESPVYIRLAAITLLCGILFSVNYNLYRLNRQPWKLAVLNMTMLGLQVAASIFLVVGLGMRLIGHFTAQLGTALVYLAVSAVLLKNWLRPRRLDFRLLGTYCKLGLPYVFSVLGVLLIANVGRFFLKTCQGLEEVGFYGVASQVAAALGMATGAFQMAIWPYALSIQHTTGARKTYSTILSAFYLVAAACAVGLSLFAREILSVFTSSAYAPASRIVAPLAFYIVWVGVAYVASLGSWMAKKTINLAISIAVAVPFCLAINFLLVPRFGGLGAALATLLAEMAYVVVLFWLSQKHYPIPFKWMHLVVISLLSLGGVLLGQQADRLAAVYAIQLKLLIFVAFLAFPLSALARRKRRLHAGEAQSGP